MTNINKQNIASSARKTMLAAVLGLTALAATASGAQAMVLHNCTDTAFSIVLEGKNGGPKPGAVVRAHSRKAIHSTKQFGPYRIVLPILGKGGWFSNRQWDGTYSLVRSAGGNIGLKNGNVCAPAAIVDPGTDPDAGAGPGNRSHYRWCFARYNSYNPETNTYTAYSGRQRECISPYI